MASFGRKNLVCFYCNKKSALKYNGLITQWDCIYCESRNFLDENGEITDPPVATDYAAPVDIKFATARPGSPPASQGYETDLFCSKCLKNQHVYTASLAQYDVETDPSHPEYRKLEREYFAYRKKLETRYPQVCEDCEPRVLERMRAAGNTAKTDHLRRLMDKSRAKRAATINKVTISGSIHAVGKWLWYTGLSGQLLWNAMALVAITERSSMISYNIPSLSAGLDMAISVSTSDRWAQSSLLCSIASIWWNPMFKQMNSGFMSHITGFGDFYSLQILLIVIRLIFYYTMGTGVFEDRFSAPSTGAHVFVFGFITFIAMKAHYSLKVDMSPLWATTPTKLPHVGPRPKGPTTNGDSMEELLDRIAAGSSQRSIVGSSQPNQEIMTGVLDGIAGSSVRGPHRSLQKSSPSLPAYNVPRSGIGRTRPSQFSSERNSNPQTASQRRTSPSLLDMTPSEARTYIETGEMPSRLEQDNQSHLNGEEMEWSPSQPSSQVRAFNPAPRALQSETRQFNEAPASDQATPFWFKVPPAPVTPAQRLRNPPPLPTLRVSSQEVKENFFNNITHRSSGSTRTGDRSTQSGTDKTRHEMQLSQQTFFPPPVPSEAGNTLAELLTSFTLSSSEPASPTVQQTKRSIVRHVFSGVGLLLGLYFWTNAVNGTPEHAKNTMLTVMAGCALVGLRIIFDNTIFTVNGKRRPVCNSLGACFGGFGLAAAGYGIVEILAGRANCPNCAVLGTTMIGGMFIHEMGIVLFV